MNLAGAIEYYHSLLDDNTAVELAGYIRDASQAGKMAFGGRLLCNVLRPNLMTYEQVEYIKREVAILLGAFATLYHALLEDSALRSELHLTEGEQALAAIDPGFTVPTPSTRLDSFFTPSSLRFVEYNAESPAGIAYEDGLAQIFRQSPVWEQFTRRYSAEHLPCRPPLLETLLNTYRDWVRTTGKSSREKPVIAIIDWKGLPTQTEFELLSEYFNRQGVPTFIGDPDSLEYTHGQLTANGKPFDLLYKRMLTGEFLDYYGLERALNHPIVRALRDGAICMTNSFRAKLLHKKAIFALLTDPANMHLFTAEEVRAIHDHIPWTRHVHDTRSTSPSGDAIELLPYTREHKHDLVLKPNDEYGGKGVLLGWEMDATAWDKAIENALDADYLVQERVPVQPQLFPSYDNGLVYSERMVDLDPYIFDGAEMRGILTRLSASSLLNVTAGGGSVAPTFLLRERV